MIKRILFATPVGVCITMVGIWYCWILTSSGTVKAFHLTGQPYAALVVWIVVAVFFLAILWAVSEVSKHLESDARNRDYNE